jgi:hypothetical protein
VLHAVAELPEHTGQASAAQVSEDLAAVTNRGADELVRDDRDNLIRSPGFRRLLRARQCAVASGPVLRPAVTDLPSGACSAAAGRAESRPG